MLAVSGRSGDVRASAAEAVKQDFLEADPYWDTSGMPNNTFKPKEPFTGKILSCKRIVGPQATGATLRWCSS